MDKMSVLIPHDSSRSATVAKASSSLPSGPSLLSWKLLGWLGVAYLIMSVIDLALGWYPVRFGTPEWEFGTVSATINGLAIPTLALYLILCSAIARERLTLVRVVSIVMICIAIFLAILFILYLTAVPLALRAVLASPLVHQGMKKAITKASVLFLGYETLYIAGALKGLRRRVAV
jgi:hypothetical protein